MSAASSFETEIEILEGAEEQEYLDQFLGWGHPPGSKWITVRCGQRRTCYPPAGYKFRHFNLDIRGRDCRNHRVRKTKDYIRVPHDCRVLGRAFVWPAEYCPGNYRNCSSW